MSILTGTVVKDTSNQLNVDIQRKTIFLGSNSYERESYTNSTGSTVNLTAGTIMGRISATGLLLPLVSTASDGSQHFVGVLTEDVDVLDTVSANVNICIQGRVKQSELVFNASEDLETVIGGRQLRDIIAGQGIKLVESTELSDFDNK